MYIEAAINFWGISEDGTLKNVVEILKEKEKKFTSMSLPVMTGKQYRRLLR